MHKVLTLNAISPVIHDYLKSDAYEISDDVATPDAILVRSAKLHDYDMPDSLLCIGRAGAGVNNIPLDKCAELGIVAFNTPGANANGVKELVLCGLLLSARRVVAGINWAQGLKGEGDAVKGKVEKGKKQFGGSEIGGKTLGVVGLGAIGAMVANSAEALGMTVIGYDPYLSEAAAQRLSSTIKVVDDLDALYAESDYVSIHVPLLDSTRHSFNAEVFGKMKDGAVLLNFSRNELVDNKALLEALESGKLGQYVIDFPSEELLGHDKVIAIPHLGASTKESEENCAMMAAKQVDEYIQNGNIINSVNYPNLSLPRSGNTRICVLHKSDADVASALGECTTETRGEYAYTIADVCCAGPAEALTQMDGVLRVRVL